MPAVSEEIFMENEAAFRIYVKYHFPGSGMFCVIRLEKNGLEGQSHEAEDGCEQK